MFTLYYAEHGASIIIYMEHSQQSNNTNKAVTDSFMLSPSGSKHKGYILSTRSYIYIQTLVDDHYSQTPKKLNMSGEKMTTPV